MHRHNRNNLVKELWRLRCHKKSEPPSSSGATRGSDSDDMRLKSSLNSLLKRLQVDELEALLESVKSKGRDATPCVLTKLPQNTKDDSVTCSGCTLSSPAAAEDATRLACAIWRWPDLDEGDRLKRIPSCRPSCDQEAPPSDGPPPLGSYLHGESEDSCINPYHWCRTIILGR